MFINDKVPTIIMTNLTVIISFVLVSTVSADIENILQNTILPGLDECGYESVSRIIGGTETNAGEFPWLAALEYNKEGTQESQGIKCVGSIINKRFVLTAGHCISPPEHDLVKVWLGVWKIYLAETADKDKVKKFDIEKKILHESYSDPFSGNDIALVKLNEDITYSHYIRPICLPKQDLNTPSYGSRLTISGWGTTETGSRSDVKLKVDLPIVDNSVCENKLEQNVGATQICAGSEEGKDSCINDSGAPLMTNAVNPATSKTHWYPHGLVSFGGDDCGVKDVPGVYTKISKFVDWILKTVE